MAIFREIFCHKCKKVKNSVHRVGQCISICGECEQKDQDEKKNAYLNSLAKLSIEERLRRIEESLRLIEEAMYNASLLK